jgi:hypothetical protein
LTLLLHRQHHHHHFERQKKTAMRAKGRVETSFETANALALDDENEADSACRAE